MRRSTSIHGKRVLTHYVENRRAWAARIAGELDTPDHVCLDHRAADDQAAGCAAFASAVDALGQSHNFIVIDTPGHDGQLTQLAHSIADTLITPLNDSFVDFDVLGTIDPENFSVTGVSHYSNAIEEVRRQRPADKMTLHWLVLRNRISVTATRNKKLVGTALQELSSKLGFRLVDGFAERMIFREFYPRGLTALDDLNEATLGTRPTMSHASARLEVANLVASMRLGRMIERLETEATSETSGQSLDAA